MSSFFFHPGLQWQYKHTIDIVDSRADFVWACYWVSNQHLAVCVMRCVKVYKVTTEGSHLAYQLSSNEWNGMWTTGVAVSIALPDSMLVVCRGKRYVYQFPCHEATQEVKKYKIQGDEVDTRCLVANANTAVVKLPNEKSTVVVCNLPDFNHQIHVKIGISPYDFSISTDYLLVVSGNEMLVKRLVDMNQDLCKIKPPGGCTFSSVSFRNDAREIYAACEKGEKGWVYRYRLDVGMSQYVSTGCIIDGLVVVRYRSLTVASDGLLALREFGRNIKVYSLQ